jgi:two-component system, OmpR family, response regulator CpxR
MLHAVPRILIIDDDPALLHCLCELLTYRLQPAVVVVQASSEDVVANMGAEHYDDVVCDLKMPGQDGLEVIRRIKRAIPNQRIILITGCIEESIDQQAYNEGVNAVLRKPLDRDEMVSVIRSVVGSSDMALKLTGEDAEGFAMAPV